MSVTPSGILSLPLSRLRDLLASTATWQTLTETTSAADAANSIFYIERQVEPEPRRVFAIVDWTNEWFNEKVGTGAFGTYEDGGTLNLWIESEVDPESEMQDGEALLQFGNSLGALVAEMKALAGSAGLLATKRYSFVMAPAIVADDEKGDVGRCIACMLQIEWGVFA